ncbi:LysR family transcriptional regulator [Xanthobacter sp. DSM 24535]|uniref:LysR family transcriptional regulator n=1 Tax=Roseixanthobacter psychrophilus TaxID=3119917 RepID=UPI00372BAB8C
MDLRHLRYFTTVALEGSFSRAAEKLNMAQPPLSRQIQQLEDELGVRLLNRGRPLTLTDAGRHLFEQGAQVLQRVEEIKATTRRIGMRIVFQFNIGFVASTLYDTLPELIREFRIHSPEVEVQLIEMTTLEQIAALKDGRIDVGFGRLRFEDDALVREVLREEPLCVAIAESHELKAATDRPRFADLEAEPLILYPHSPRPSYADQVLSFYREAGVTPRIGMEARDVQTALGLVASGVGVCVVPASIRRLGRSDVRFLDIDEPFSSPIIVSHRRNDSSALLRQLLQLTQRLKTRG